MKLAKAVSNPQGVLLLREGETLTDRHLQVFRTWHILEAEVTMADGSEPAGAASPPEEPEAVCEIPPGIEEEITHRFRHAEVSSDPVMAEIRQQAAIRVSIRTRGRQSVTDGPVQEAV
jgi:hypothetical protein